MTQKCISNPPANYPTPTPEDLESPMFEAIWQTIKGWDINVPEWYEGYTHAEGNHAMAILNAIRDIANNPKHNQIVS